MRPQRPSAARGARVVPSSNAGIESLNSFMTFDSESFKFDRNVNFLYVKQIGNNPVALYRIKA